MWGIVTLLGQQSFCYASEADLQAAIERVFDVAGVHAEREVRLTARDRIDFLVDRVGVEIKIDGGSRDVERQLRRYLESDCIDGVLLVTTRSKHRAIEQGTVTAGDPPSRKALRVLQLTTTGL